MVPTRSRIGRRRLPRFQSGAPTTFEPPHGSRYLIASGVKPAGMFRLVNNRYIGSHEMTLSTETPGLALYAYTFVSCVVL